MFFLQISPFSGSSSTRNPGGAENVGVALQLCLPCYFHATPLALCDDVMMYSLQLTRCTALSHNPPTHTVFHLVNLSQLLRMYYKNKMWVSRRNAIRILCPIKLFPFTRSESLSSHLPFTIQALPIITPYPVVYNTNLGYPVTQLKEGWFCQTGSCKEMMPKWTWRFSNCCPALPCFCLWWLWPLAWSGFSSFKATSVVLENVCIQANQLKPRSLKSGKLSNQCDFY